MASLAAWLTKTPGQPTVGIFRDESRFLVNVAISRATARTDVPEVVRQIEEAGLMVD